MIIKVLKITGLAFQELYWILRWLYSFIKFFIKYGRLDKFLTINKKIFVIGNGPSTDQVIILQDKLDEYELLCVNFFALDEEKFFALKPKYYMGLDGDLFVKNCERIAEKKKKLLCVLEKVTWEMYLITPRGKRFLIKNDYIKSIQLNNNIYNGNFDLIRNFLFKRNLAIPQIITVMNGALYFAITCNAKEIFMLGVETDFVIKMYINEDNELVHEHKHFYGVEVFNYTKMGVNIKGEYYLELYFQHIMFKCYYILNKYAQYKKIPVFNCTMKSLIDVFPKVEIEKVINK